MWVDGPYAIIGPDGTRIVVGNGADALADPDFASLLDPENGIQGILDRAGIREAYSDFVEEDAGSQGPSYLSRRSGTITGILIVDDALTPLLVEAARIKIKRALRALQADALLQWTPPGGDPRQLRLRVQDGPHFGGRRPKTWQATVTSTDPYALSVVEQSQTLAADLTSSVEISVADPFTDPIGVSSAVGRGIPNPIPEPIVSTESSINQTLVAIVSDGDAPTWPWFRITGPVTNPTLLNNTTGESWSLTYTLGVGEFLDVLPQYGRILAGGTADRYSALDFAASTWWQLQPGSNDVRLLADAYSAGAEFTVYWRDAYE